MASSTIPKVSNPGLVWCHFRIFFTIRRIPSITSSSIIVPKRPNSSSSIVWLGFLLLFAGGGFHGQLQAAAVVDSHQFDSNQLAFLDDIAGLGDAVLAELTNVHQAVLA